ARPRRGKPPDRSRAGLRLRAGAGRGPGRARRRRSGGKGPRRAARAGAHAPRALPRRLRAGRDEGAGPRAPARAHRAAPAGAGAAHARHTEGAERAVIELGVNVDHVATVRQARRTYEPDPVGAAVEAHMGGADGITVHLREDRRHIEDADVRRLRELSHIKLNLEMAATDEMVDIGVALRPEMAMLVPEGRHEITTERGLDIVSQETKIAAAIARLADADVVTSVFIDAEPAQVSAAARVGAAVCEIHTGPYAEAFHRQGRDAES